MELYPIAAHEAAHILVGTLIGHRIKTARIRKRPRRGSQGETNWHPAVLTIEHQLWSLAAGPIAQRYVTDGWWKPDDDPDDVLDVFDRKYGGYDDFQKIRRLLEHRDMGLTQAARSRILFDAIWHTFHILTDHWPIVEDVAKELLTRKRLDERDIRLILRRHTRTHPQDLQPETIRFE